MVLCYLVLGVDQFTPYDAHYFPESETILSRLSEPKNYSASAEPQGVTGLCAELPCTVGDELWRASDEEVGRRVLNALSQAGLPVSAPVQSVFVRRVPHVYPIYDLGFETRFQATDAYLHQFSGLIVLGRQGLFAHDNTHHTIEMAYRASTCLQSNLSWDTGQWARYREEFESHVVED